MEKVWLISATFFMNSKVWLLLSKKQNNKKKHNKKTFQELKQQNIDICQV